MHNEVTLIGNLGQEPELKHTQNGNAVCNLSVATGKKWTDKQGQKKEKTEWHRVVCWQRVAEAIAEYGNKGDKVLVKGELETRKWQDESGNDRFTTEIVASKCLLLNTRDKPTVGEQEKMQGQGKLLDKEYKVETDASFTADDIPF